MSPKKRSNNNFIEREKEIQKKEFERINQAKYNMLGAWLFTIPMIVWILIEQVLGIVWPSETIFDIGMIVLAAPPLFIFGKETFTNAFKVVIQGNVNMDLLIVIGSGIAYLTGLATFFSEIGNYTDVAATIIAFHLTGKYFEEKSKERISRDIEELVELRAKTAALIENHQVREIAVEELEPGDIILVRSAETIPADGKIIKGKTKVDESMLNGKTSPVQKSAGDEVIGATVNQYGIIEIKVTRVGENSCLFQFVNMIEKAEKTRIPIQKDAEKITGALIPLVLIIAVFTFLIWLLFPESLHSIGNWAHSYLPWVNPQISGFSLGIFSAIAVLVVACPCALGMATPTALLVGVGIGEENGILIKNGKIIETMQDVDVIAFDMTGNITRGQLQKTEFKNINKELNNLGIKTAIIGKKDKKTGEAISRSTDITFTASEVSIENKLAELEMLKDRFGVAAVLGDISNNSKILTEADVGIGITSGSKMAGNNSDFLLIDGDLSSVIKVVKLSRNIYKKIRENIFWAIIYNLVTIPFAMLAFLHPAIAELVMAGSSMSVVANARNLRKENIEPDYQKK